MNKYELHSGGDSLRLTGGQLLQPLDFPANDGAAAIHVVGFLSQRHSSILEIFDAVGKLIDGATRSERCGLGAVGGLNGPR
ncbi:MAG: hypothetical protein ACR2NX_04275 [Chthoniobacterales bacterium]